MIIFANAKRLLTSQFLRKTEILSCENDEDKGFENSNNKMNLLFRLLAKCYRNFVDLISLLSSHFPS